MLYIQKRPYLTEINLKNANDKELNQISQELALGLSIDEMKIARNYFLAKKRNPTDIELQAIAQAWSEHCCYKSSKIFLKEFIFPINSKKVIDRGDAGVIEFDRKHCYALRIESHNHPSAVEPYGGSATGIGGIVRDVLCMGAQPIALIDPLFFGELDYPYEKLPKGVKHPKYLFGGVVAGIRDYGNRIGIPTVCGSVYFDNGYVGNPIINVGCVGFANRKNLLKNRVKKIGDNLVLVGGKTGRDGIHGVTFASAVLTEKSEEESRGAVQLGDPITEEPTIHACLECAEKKLLNGMKDLGGGGLSCVVGEIVNASNFGAEVELSKVPLKEEGLMPWEIWISESQERMMLAVDDKNLKEVLEIFKLWDVLATPIGKVIKEKVVRLFYKGEKVFELNTEFYVKAPEYCRIVKPEKKFLKKKEKLPKQLDNYNKILIKLLSSPNIANKDWVIRQYDHEVRGNTIIKPLQGKINKTTHGDAVVLKPLTNSFRALALAVSSNPSVSEIAPYFGGKTIMDELCRNLVSVGALPDSITNCLNFGNPEIPTRLWQFKEVLRGIGEVCSYLNIPSPSGNVSFYNESELGVVPPTATVLGVGIVKDIRKCITVDLKKEGNPIYLVGETKDELGGSEYFKLTNSFSNKVPDVDLQNLKKSIKLLTKAIEKELVVSCHDVSQGGFGVSIAEMCFGGVVGIEIEFNGKLRDDFLLFSESNTRWACEVKKGKENEFEKTLKEIKHEKVGEVKGNEILIKNGKKKLVNLEVEKARKVWNRELWERMG